MHPYDLLTGLRQRSEHQAAVITRGSVYDIVAALASAGWVTETARLRQGNRPERTVYTLTDPGEAIGIVRAARDTGVPIAVSFTVETDGRLPDRTSLAEAIGAVDATAPPDYFLVNCAHPTHIAPALAEDGRWRDRIHGLRANASRRSHAELDEADELDDGESPYRD